MRDVRPSPIAGTWYPGTQQTLAASIDHLLETVKEVPFSGHVLGLIVPHAGHRYSGLVAAHAFKCLAHQTPQVVAIVSPLHYPHPGLVLTTAHAAYATPLGEVPVDQELLNRLAAALQDKASLHVDRVRNDQEHSLEIELPFLQRALHQPFRLLPIMLRDQTYPTAAAVGKALAEVLSDAAALLIASTDLSHFYPDAVARKYDAEMLSRIEDFDPAGVIAAEEEMRGFACGKGAVAAVLRAAKLLGADQVRVLQYANSGDVTGDYSSVVGYGAAVILRIE
jgi:AmmeMemoRadiSam system protein B